MRASRAMIGPSTAPVMPVVMTKTIVSVWRHQFAQKCQQLFLQLLTWAQAKGLLENLTEHPRYSDRTQHARRQSHS
jgi:hypothetical protein